MRTQLNRRAAKGDGPPGRWAWRRGTKVDSRAAFAPRSRASSALRDLAFLVREVLPAHGAELLDLELLGHGPLVLGRRVVGAGAVAARHFDQVAHYRETPLGGGEVIRGRRHVKSGGPRRAA